MAPEPQAPAGPTDSQPVGVVSLNDLALVVSQLTSRSIKQLLKVSNGLPIEEAVTGGCDGQDCGCYGSKCDCNTVSSSPSPSLVESFLKERESNIADLKKRIEALETGHGQ